jgi:hypothetical protein
MKKGGLVVVIAIAALGFAIFRGAKSFAQNLRVQFNDVAIDLVQTKKALYLTLFYKLKLTFINPESVKADITNMSIDVFFGDKNVGTIRRTSLFTIPSRDSVQVEFELSIPTIKLGLSIRELISMLSAGGSLPSVTLQGFLQTQVGRISVNQTLPIT